MASIFGFGERLDGYPVPVLPLDMLAIETPDLIKIDIEGTTTNRDGIGRNLDLGIFNPAQTRLLATQQLDITEGLLIVESPTDDVFVLVRLAPPHPALRSRFEQELGDMVCGNIGQ